MRSSDRVKLRITPLDVLGNPDESRSVETFGQFKMELSTEPQDPPRWIHGQTPDGGEVWLRADLFTETAPGVFTTGAHPMPTRCEATVHDGQGTTVVRCERKIGHRVPANGEYGHRHYGHLEDGRFIEWQDPPDPGSSIFRTYQ